MKKKNMIKTNMVQQFNLLHSPTLPTNSILMINHIEMLFARFRLRLLNLFFLLCLPFSVVRCCRCDMCTTEECILRCIPIVWHYWCLINAATRSRTNNTTQLKNNWKSCSSAYHGQRLCNEKWVGNIKKYKCIKIV